MAAPQASSRLEMLQARFQQKQLQEKEQKLLQLYDQQQQRAYQVVQRGSAGSTGSNQGSTVSHHSVTKTSTTTHSSTSSQGGKVRQMFDERRQTTVKGIDRSYPLEPLDNKPKKHVTSNGHVPSKPQNGTVTRQTVTVKRLARADVNSNVNGGKPVVSYHEEVSHESYDNEDEFGNENDNERYTNGNHHNVNRNGVHIEEVVDDDLLARNRMLAKIHLLELDKNMRHRVNNDLESEQFPEELMLDVPDKLAKKPATRKLSQAEARLERFKNANAKRSNITTTVTRKRSNEPIFPARTSPRETVARTRTRQTVETRRSAEPTERPAKCQSPEPGRKSSRITNPIKPDPKSPSTVESSSKHCRMLKARVSEPGLRDVVSRRQETRRISKVAHDRDIRDCMEIGTQSTKTVKNVGSSSKVCKLTVDRESEASDRSQDTFLKVVPGREDQEIVGIGSETSGILESVESNSKHHREVMKARVSEPGLRDVVSRRQETRRISKDASSNVVYDRDIRDCMEIGTESTKTVKNVGSSSKVCKLTVDRESEATDRSQDTFSKVVPGREDQESVGIGSETSRILESVESNSKHRKVMKTRESEPVLKGVPSRIQDSRRFSEDSFMKKDTQSVDSNLKHYETVIGQDPKSAQRELPSKGQDVHRFSEEAFLKKVPDQDNRKSTGIDYESKKTVERRRSTELKQRSIHDRSPVTDRKTHKDIKHQEPTAELERSSVRKHGQIDALRKTSEIKRSLECRPSCLETLEPKSEQVQLTDTHKPSEPGRTIYRSQSPEAQPGLSKITNPRYKHSESLDTVSKHGQAVKTTLHPEPSHESVKDQHPKCRRKLFADTKPTEIDGDSPESIKRPGTVKTRYSSATEQKRVPGQSPKQVHAFSQNTFTRVKPCTKRTVPMGTVSTHTRTEQTIRTNEPVQKVMRSQSPESRFTRPKSVNIASVLVDTVRHEESTDSVRKTMRNQSPEQRHKDMHSVESNRTSPRSVNIDSVLAQTVKNKQSIDSVESKSMKTQKSSYTRPRNIGITSVLSEKVKNKLPTDAAETIIQSQRPQPAVRNPQDKNHVVESDLKDTECIETIPECAQTEKTERPFHVLRKIAQIKKAIPENEVSGNIVELMELQNPESPQSMETVADRIKRYNELTQRYRQELKPECRREPFRNMNVTAHSESEETGSGEPEAKGTRPSGRLTGGVLRSESPEPKCLESKKTTHHIESNGSEKPRSEFEEYWKTLRSTDLLQRGTRKKDIQMEIETTSTSDSEKINSPQKKFIENDTERTEARTSGKLERGVIRSKSPKPESMVSKDTISQDDSRRIRPAPGKPKSEKNEKSVRTSDVTQRNNLIARNVHSKSDGSDSQKLEKPKTRPSEKHTPEIIRSKSPEPVSIDPKNTIPHGESHHIRPHSKTPRSEFEEYWKTLRATDIQQKSIKTQDMNMDCKTTRASYSEKTSFPRKECTETAETKPFSKITRSKSPEPELMVSKNPIRPDSRKPKPGLEKNEKTLRSTDLVQSRNLIARSVHSKSEGTDFPKSKTVEIRPSGKLTFEGVRSKSPESELLGSKDTVSHAKPNPIHPNSGTPRSEFEEYWKTLRSTDVLQRTTRDQDLNLECETTDTSFSEKTSSPRKEYIKGGTETAVTKPFGKLTPSKSPKPATLVSENTIPHRTRADSGKPRSEFEEYWQTLRCTNILAKKTQTEPSKCDSDYPPKSEQKVFEKPTFSTVTEQVESTSESPDFSESGFKYSPAVEKKQFPKVERRSDENESTEYDQRISKSTHSTVHDSNRTAEIGKSYRKLQKTKKLVQPEPGTIRKKTPGSSVKVIKKTFPRVPSIRDRSISAVIPAKRMPFSKTRLQSTKRQRKMDAVKDSEESINQFNHEEIMRNRRPVKAVRIVVQTRSLEPVRTVSKSKSPRERPNLRKPQSIGTHPRHTRIMDTTPKTRKTGQSLKPECRRRLYRDTNFIESNTMQPEIVQVLLKQSDRMKDTRPTELERETGRRTPEFVNKPSKVIAMKSTELLQRAIRNQSPELQYTVTRKVTPSGKRSPIQSLSMKQQPHPNPQNLRNASENTLSQVKSYLRPTESVRNHHKHEDTEKTTNSTDKIQKFTQDQNTELVSDSDSRHSPQNVQNASKNTSPQIKSYLKLTESVKNHYKHEDSEKTTDSINAMQTIEKHQNIVPVVDSEDELHHRTITTEKYSGKNSPIQSLRIKKGSQFQEETKMGKSSESSKRTFRSRRPQTRLKSFENTSTQVKSYLKPTESVKNHYKHESPTESMQTFAHDQTTIPLVDSDDEHSKPVKTDSKHVPIVIGRKNAEPAQYLPYNLRPECKRRLLKETNLTERDLIQPESLESAPKYPGTVKPLLQRRVKSQKIRRTVKEIFGLESDSELDSAKDDSEYTKPVEPMRSTELVQRAMRNKNLQLQSGATKVMHSEEKSPSASRFVDTDSQPKDTMQLKQPSEASKKNVKSNSPEHDVSKSLYPGTACSLKHLAMVEKNPSHYTEDVKTESSPELPQRTLIKLKPEASKYKSTDSRSMDTTDSKQRVVQGRQPKPVHEFADGKTEERNSQSTKTGGTIRSIELVQEVVQKQSLKLHPEDSSLRRSGAAYPEHQEILETCRLRSQSPEPACKHPEARDTPVQLTKIGQTIKFTGGTIKSMHSRDSSPAHPNSAESDSKHQEIVETRLESHKPKPACRLPKIEDSHLQSTITSKLKQTAEITQKRDQDRKVKRGSKVSQNIEWKSYHPKRTVAMKTDSSRSESIKTRQSVRLKERNHQLLESLKKDSKLSETAKITRSVKTGSQHRFPKLNIKSETKVTEFDEPSSALPKIRKRISDHLETKEVEHPTKSVRRNDQHQYPKPALRVSERIVSQVTSKLKHPKSATRSVKLTTVKQTSRPTAFARKLVKEQNSAPKPSGNVLSRIETNRKRKEFTKPSKSTDRYAARAKTLTQNMKPECRRRFLRSTTVTKHTAEYPESMVTGPESDEIERTVESIRNRSPELSESATFDCSETVEIDSKHPEVVEMSRSLESGCRIVHTQSPKPASRDFIERKSTRTNSNCIETMEAISSSKPVQEATRDQGPEPQRRTVKRRMSESTDSTERDCDVELMETDSERHSTLEMKRTDEPESKVIKSEHPEVTNGSPKSSQFIRTSSTLLESGENTESTKAMQINNSELSHQKSESVDLEGTARDFEYCETIIEPARRTLQGEDSVHTISKTSSPRVKSNYTRIVKPIRTKAKATDPLKPKRAARILKKPVANENSIPVQKKITSTRVKSTLRSPESVHVHATYTKTTKTTQTTKLSQEERRSQTIHKTSTSTDSTKSNYDRQKRVQSKQSVKQEQKDIRTESPEPPRKYSKIPISRAGTLEALRSIELVRKAIGNQRPEEMVPSESDLKQQESVKICSDKLKPVRPDQSIRATQRDRRSQSPEISRIIFQSKAARLEHTSDGSKTEETHSKHIKTTSSLRSASLVRRAIQTEKSTVSQIKDSVQSRPIRNGSTKTDSKSTKTEKPSRFTEPIQKPIQNKIPVPTTRISKRSDLVGPSQRSTSTGTDSGRTETAIVEHYTELSTTSMKCQEQQNGFEQTVLLESYPATPDSLEADPICVQSLVRTVTREQSRAEPAYGVRESMVSLEPRSSSPESVESDFRCLKTRQILTKTPEPAHRVTKSPSPDPVVKKSSGSTVRTSTHSVRRSVPASPTKSPDFIPRRGSAGAKSPEPKSTKNSSRTAGRISEVSGSNKAAQVAKSPDVVDVSDFENNSQLQSSFDDSKPTKVAPTVAKKNAEAFVLEFDAPRDSGENGTAAVKKALPRKQASETQKLRSPTASPYPRPLSSLSTASSSSSARGLTPAGSGGKMATKSRTQGPGARGPPSGKSTSGVVSNDALVPCKMCGRRFAQDRVALHEQICAKTGAKKRKQFDAMMFRVKGTDLEPFVKKGGSKKAMESKNKKPEAKSNWRRKHEDFINAIRSAKQVQAHLAAGGKLSDLPPPPASDTSDYIQCPHCGRKFNAGAAERHIPKCQTMMHNKPNPRAPPKPKR